MLLHRAYYQLIYVVENIFTKNTLKIDNKKDIKW